ncbi:MAG: S41 family peptidase [Rhodospirillales bacterium]|nr:S41 family peptidase [Rhodospirillales bacterium]
MKRSVVVVALILALMTPGVDHVDAASSETYRQLNLFGDVFERVRAEYVEEVTDEELIEAAIRGMLVSLDPHSSYLSPKNFDEMQVQTRGEFGGLGIEVTMEDGFVKVVSPIDDTPADRAGIKAGDYVTHLDDEPVLGLTLGEAVDKMRGPVKTDITLTIVREGADEPLEITVTRDIITIKSVRWRMEDKVGYVRITSFTEQTEEGLIDALESMEAEAGEELQGVVVDLRNNPGGLLDQAIAVSDVFLDQGEIVSTRGRRDDSTQRFNARPGDLAQGLPVVVLINAGSASASEIVAGALQDHQRAIIMGEQSFGKGSVQTIIPLPSHGAMRLTTARYYTPSGISIQATGIAPDILVKEATIASEEEEDDFAGEADLRNSLDGDGHEEDMSGRSEEALDDYQLGRALDLLEGLALVNALNGMSVN